MTTAKNHKTKTKNKRMNKTSKPARRPRVAKRNALTPVERMIADPCHGPIEPIYTSEFGGGTVLKVRRRVPIHDLSSARNGFLLWYPDYANGGQDGLGTTQGKSQPVRAGGANLFLYEAEDPSIPPTNSSAAGGYFGTGVNAQSPEGVSLPDPGFDIGINNNVSGMRTLGACMRIIYTGRADFRSGEFVAVHRLPSSGLVNTEGAVTSPADLLTYGYDTFRTKDKELIWRPGSNSEHPRKPGTLAFGSVSQEGVEDSFSDSAFRVGYNTQPTKVSNDSQPGESSGFGFAWFNLPANASSDVYIEITKIVQFQFSPINRTMEPVPYQIRDKAAQQTPDEAVAGVDRKCGPGWSLRDIGSYAQQASDMIQDVALGGLQLANTYHMVRNRSLRGAGQQDYLMV
ncbi:hypothetical protein 2 [Wenzhou tombus-like virus 8]|uniref:hypothetical protein 2 n=1 Tax=Wenzhou tombus-like virus 8 TaxID=1923678 RepID=UPI00090AFE1D|nr:hypothetical protein 2 [Wenzhou tombus-like virus 8]APG76102.1 hypothetical protein 2 [Wenzhou tombus-like virus 8]